MISDIMSVKAYDGEIFYKKLSKKEMGIDYEKIFSEDENNGFEDKINSCISKKENYMFSPISIKTMMMLANGAEGNTKLKF